MRQLIIGDVHGCSTELLELLQQFSPTADDQIFQVGDLINKGPDSLGCLQLVKEWNIRCVRGNHEAKLLRILDTPITQRTTKESAYLEKIGAGVQAEADFIRSWPLWIDDENFTMVHAGLEPHKTSLAAMSHKALLTIRTWDGKGENLDREGDPAWFELVQWSKPVFFGHWALLGLQLADAYKCLDSGCVYGRQLSGFCPQENRLYQVQAKQEYVSLVKGLLIT